MVTAMLENKYNFIENVENEAMLVCNNTNYTKKKKEEKIFRIKKKWCIKWAQQDIRMKTQVHDKSKVTKIVKFIFKPSYSKYLSENTNTNDVFKNSTQLFNNINTSMNGRINNRNTNNENINNNSTGAEHSIGNNNTYTMSSSSVSRSISANGYHTSNTSNYVEDNVLDHENEYQNGNEHENEYIGDDDEYINYIIDDNTNTEFSYITQKQFPAACDYCECKVGGTNQRETLESLKRRYKTLYGDQPFLPGFCFIYEINKHQYEFCEDCFKAVVS